MVQHKMWVVLIACIAVHAGSTSGVVKTTKGESCVFPFTYQGVVYNKCTTKNHNRPWCSTTAVYSGKWGNCAAPPSGGVKTTKGESCVFPFTYQGVVYNKCTTKNHNRPWCSTTAVYSGKWGNCAAPPSGGVKTTKGESCVFPFTYQGVVYNKCTTKNHNRPWCSTTAVYSGKWGNCAAPPSGGVKTTKGESCVFPFTYQGVVYNKCTTKNHNRPWCSTTAVYSGKWGNCAAPPSGGVKTTKGESCVFPFTYQGVVYNKCTTKNHNRPWCSTTAVYSGKWGNCAAPPSGGVKTTKGESCVFPFTYQGVVYNKCTTKNHNRPWCSTTAVYSGKWGNCAEPVPPTTPTTPASKWEPLGCYADAQDRAMPKHFKTVASDDYKYIFDECSKAAEEKGYDYFGVQYQNECWGSKNAHATYDKHGCKDNCKVKGDYGVGDEWSNFMYHLKSEWTGCSAKKCGAGVKYKLILSKDPRPNCPPYNVKIKSSTTITKPCSAPKPCPVKTTKGESCVFPFTYQGVVYNKCTTKNHNRPWCSTTAVYSGKWGNCAE